MTPPRRRAGTGASPDPAAPARPAARRDAPARPEVLTRPGDLAGYEDGWRDLAAGQSYFTGPDWALAWWETTAGGGAGRVAVWPGPDGTVEAVAPLFRARRRLHPRLPVSVTCLAPLGAGAGAADHLGFPALPHRRDDVRRWLAEQARATTLHLPNLDEDSAPLLPPGALPLTRTGSPRIDLTADPASLGSAQHRQNLRRYRRKLDAAGVTFRWVAPAEMTGAVLDEVLRLHRARAESIGRATRFTARRRPLHLRLIERGAGERGPCALLAEHGGRAVGAVYGFWWPGGYAYYQTGWDPQFAPLRLGLQIVAETIGQVRARGAAVFDFLRGGEPYKYRFGAVDRFDTDHLVPRGVPGALLRAKYRAKNRADGRDGGRAGGTAGETAVRAGDGGRERGRNRDSDRSGDRGRDADRGRRTGRDGDRVGGP